MNLILPKIIILGKSNNCRTHWELAKLDLMEQGLESIERYLFCFQDDICFNIKLW